MYINTLIRLRYMTVLPYLSLACSFNCCTFFSSSSTRALNSPTSPFNSSPLFASARLFSLRCSHGASWCEMSAALMAEVELVALSVTSAV